ncbi:MAG TPA: L-aspartate oxidase [Acholeplasmatales bacterium]|nr:L-aspartate oxidase [Acholeplasmatales bacterium]
MDHKTDILIIGSGMAGLVTALFIDPRLSVAIVAKESFANSNSMLAQGGIAVELEGEPEGRLSHYNDTLKAGAYLNDPEAVRLLVDQGGIAIKKLMELGVEYDRDAENKILFTKEGGHSRRRIVHAGGDASGYHTTKTLLDLVLERANIELYEHTMALDLLVEAGICRGATVLKKDTEYFSIYARKTVLATGGIGSVYGSTTNDLSATGDGLGLALRAGAEVKNMEFVQFHPTAFFNEESKSRQRFLISEAVRGEGAKLLNVEKVRFMPKYNAELMELAPRDVVSQAIYREMYDTWTDHVYLDTTHMDPKALEKRFPTIFATLKSHGLIMGIDLIPVSPCEHFSCGGIKTDLHARTNVENLYAVGECASTGVHGANRLASNSLLECMVFGLEAASDINAHAAAAPLVEVKYPAPVPSYSYNYKPIRKKIGDYMDEHVGIVRNTDGLVLTLQMVDTVLQNLKKYPNLTKNYYETLNLATTSKLITEQALARKESIGCHLRIK